MVRDSQMRQLVSVILAAGKGTRMHAPELHKVCQTLNGKTVIERALEQYNKLGANPHVIVAGDKAEQVMRAASASSAQCLYAFQAIANGTGGAAHAAADVLKAMHYNGDVLVVAGDKVMETPVLMRLLDEFRASNSDLAFAVGNVDDFPTSGRIAREQNGNILGIVEVADISRARLLRDVRQRLNGGCLDSATVTELAVSYMKTFKKASGALQPIWSYIEEGGELNRELFDSAFTDSDEWLPINGIRLSPDDACLSREANLSVYLFKAEALYHALEHLSSNNAQNEFYLTDCVSILAAEGKSLMTVPIQHPEEIMGFNTPDEMAEIEKRYALRPIAVTESAASVRPASHWHDTFANSHRDAVLWLERIYGCGNACITEKRHRIVGLLGTYINLHGDEPVIISRAPGRINIMGRHVDHQGGYVNMIASERDVYTVMGLRADQRYSLSNLNSALFPDCEFELDDLVSEARRTPWHTFVDGQFVQSNLERNRGQWGQYCKSAHVRMAAEYPHHDFKGVNAVVAGDIPIAAGLSSSSALVVATMEGLMALNGLEMEPESFVEMCGEAEWFVGTRGGAGDHAAMKYSRRDCVSQVGFFPCHLAGRAQFPAGCVVYVCNSHQQARKTSGARDAFNHRVACYHISREMIKRANPHLVRYIEHLRDIQGDNLGMSDSELLQLVLSLPIAAARAELLDELGPRFCSPLFDTHNDPGLYPLRAVTLFGLAECERSRRCPLLLHGDSVASFGEWMSISHDGDRVWRHDSPWRWDCSDESLLGLASRRDLDIASLPGAYGCSTKEIDFMIDTALAVEGVYGAQIAGAGLGGCIMVLATKDAGERLAENMWRSYYEPRGLESAVFACNPSEGSGTVCF